MSTRMPRLAAASSAAALSILAGPALAQDPATCRPGFVWREAGPGDLVCVPPEARDRAAGENARADSRRDPAGAYGPDTCVSGYVWREAFAGDRVCVTPEIRLLVRRENADGPSRRVSP